MSKLPRRSFLGALVGLVAGYVPMRKTRKVHDKEIQRYLALHGVSIKAVPGSIA